MWRSPGRRTMTGMGLCCGNSPRACCCSVFLPFAAARSPAEFRRPPRAGFLADFFELHSRPEPASAHHRPHARTIRSRSGQAQALRQKALNCVGPTSSQTAGVIHSGTFLPSGAARHSLAERAAAGGGDRVVQLHVYRDGFGARALASVDVSLGRLPFRYLSHNFPCPLGVLRQNV